MVLPVINRFQRLPGKHSLSYKLRILLKTDSFAIHNKSNEQFTLLKIDPFKVHFYFLHLTKKSLSYFDNLVTINLGREV